MCLSAWGLERRGACCLRASFIRFPCVHPLSNLDCMSRSPAHYRCPEIIPACLQHWTHPNIPCSVPFGMLGLYRAFGFVQYQAGDLSACCPPKHSLSPFRLDWVQPVVHRHICDEASRGHLPCIDVAIFGGNVCGTLPHRRPRNAAAGSHVFKKSRRLDR